MAGWKSIDVKSYRPFVHLDEKDCVCGVFLGLIPDRAYPGAAKVVLESLDGIEFEIRAGVLLAQYCEVHAGALEGSIVAISTSKKIGKMVPYHIGVWYGTAKEFADEVSNTGIIERTKAHVKEAQARQKEKK